MIKYGISQDFISREIMGRKKDTTTNFGEKLAKVRKQRGMTQEELGKKIGVSQRVIAYYEKETQYTPAGKLNLIAKALNISSDELLGVKPLKSNAPENRRLAKKLRLLEKLPKQDQSAVLSYIDALSHKRKIS